MTRLGIGLYTAPEGGDLLLDLAALGHGHAFSSNTHGFGDYGCVVPRALIDSFWLYDRAMLPWVRAEACGGAVWQGRCEDFAIVNGGVQLTALGAWRALYDVPYTALWRTTSLSEWLVAEERHLSSFKPKLYAFDKDNRLSIGLTRQIEYSTADDVGGWVFVIPHGSARNLTNWSCSYEIYLPTGWRAEWFRATTVDGKPYGAMSGVASLGSVAADGTVQTGSQAFASFDQGAVFFCIYNNTGVISTYQTETAQVVGTITGSGNATFTVTAAGMTGSPKAIAVAVLNGDTASVVAGKVRVVLAADADVSAKFTVGGTGAEVSLTTKAALARDDTINIAFTNGTCTGLTADAGSHDTTATGEFYAQLTNVVLSTGGTMVTPDEIAAALAVYVNGINSAQLSASAALVEASSLQLNNEFYEDAWPADVLDYLAGLGDGTANLYEAMVWEDQRLTFRQRNSAYRRVWYVDVSGLEVDRTLETLRNSLYGVYQDESGHTLRTAVSADAGSVARYGLTRRATARANSNSSTDAENIRNLTLNDKKNPKPRAALVFRELYDANGVRWPLYWARTGDRMVIRNLPPALSVDVDRIRTFLLAETRYAPEQDALEVVPETHRPRADLLLARLGAGIGRHD